MARDNKDLIVALDIGTSKVACLVAELRADGSLEILGMGGHESKGLKKGVVVNIEATVAAIQRALDASFSDLQWVVDAYALALATCVLTAGALADMFGRKRLFLLGIALFTIASAACGAVEPPRTVQARTSFGPAVK